MKNTLVVLYLICITIPVACMCFLKFGPLDGIKAPMPKPQLSLWSFVESKYQDSLSIYEEENNGIRNPLTKWNNEINYLAWRKGSGDIIICKDNYLMSEGYINAYLGIGADSNRIKEGLLELDSLHELLRVHHVAMLYIIAPGKASFNSEKIPKQYLKRKQGYSNYDITVKDIPKYDIPYIDFNAYFSAIKAGSTHELFPKQGTHWSVYGAAVALDSIAARTGELLKSPMNRIKSVQYNTTTTPQQYSSDADLLGCLNLAFPIMMDTFTYRWQAFEQESDTVWKPRVLFIGDSYASTFLATYLIPKYYDKRSKYWYYLDQQWDLSTDYLPAVKLNTLHIKEEVLKYDIVVFVTTEINYWRADWGLYDRIKDQRSNNAQ